MRIDRNKIYSFTDIPGNYLPYEGSIYLNIRFTGGSKEESGKQKPGSKGESGKQKPGIKYTTRKNNTRNLEDTESNSHGLSILSCGRDILFVSVDAREIQERFEGESQGIAEILSKDVTTPARSAAICLANVKRRIDSENMILENAESMYDLNVARSLRKSEQGVPMRFINMLECDIFVQENQEIAKCYRIETEIVTHESRQNKSLQLLNLQEPSQPKGQEFKNQKDMTLMNFNKESPESPSASVKIKANYYLKHDIRQAIRLQ
ncbi:hypothetical protein JTB14_027406 [Gonioctena quinquepunctata]|nr:hypothetical protein JTB14_027406 [Gonioctena quinquepunctata]